MNLENLVPPVELCKKIPAGEFADSALSWLDISKELAMFGIADENTFCVRERDILEKFAYSHERCPAPTLAEIIVEIDNLGGWCPTAYRLQNCWTVDYQEDNEDGMNDVVEQRDLDNPATAALKLWLKLKGIE